MPSTSHAVSYLRSKVREWNAGDLLALRKEQSWEWVSGGRGDSPRPDR